MAEIGVIATSFLLFIQKMMTTWTTLIEINGLQNVWIVNIF